jgi:hypothetical protein
MFILETTPGTFCLIIENQVKNDVNSNLSGKEKRALHKLITEKNKIHVINDTAKILGQQMRINLT